ncbi:MAG: hypothetical protein H8E37_06345 [Planctomycetes bacterium]|nr:hypothetical protein [Planctomycetota bacterium]
MTSDCDGCDRIKEIEEKIAKLRAKLDNGTSSSSVQQQLDLHEKDIARQAELLEKISIRLEELTGVVKDLADVTIGEENKDDKKADAGTDE